MQFLRTSHKTDFSQSKLEFNTVALIQCVLFPLIGLFLCGEELTSMVSKAQLLDLTMEFSKSYLYNYNITCSTNLTITLNH